MNKTERQELVDYLQSLPLLADEDREFRVERALADFWTFIRTYFPHHIDDAEIETSKFRKFCHNELEELSWLHKKMLFTAYRGAAKTTVITRLFSLWQLVRKAFRYEVLICATDALVEDSFDFFRTELEENQNLINDFNIEQGATWRLTELVVKVGDHLCKMQGLGAGVKVRGMNFLSYRPDFIIVDDIENDEQVESKAQRDKLERWFKRAIMKLPARKKRYRLFVVGTVLHNDSLLMRLSKRKDFVFYNFPLVVQFPHDMSDPDNINLDGLILDDPEIDGMEVMEEYFEDKDSFMSEFQNQPISKEGLLFEGYVTFETMPKCDVYYIGLDPSMGKKKGDYFGIAVIGKKDKRFYASVKGYRMSPVKLIPRIIALYAKFQKIAPTTIACETVQFQEFFKDVLKKEALSIDIPLSVKELRNTAPKVLRIDSVAPLINDGTIEIYSKDHLLIEELDTYPSSAHDDLLDALEMAYRLFRVAAHLSLKKVREKLRKKNFKGFKKKYV